MPTPDNQFSHPKPGPMLFLTAAVVGAGAAYAISTSWLTLSPGWLSVTVGGVLALWGVITGETIVEAIVLTLIFGDIMVIFVTMIPAPALVKAGFVPAACGLCAGKLVAGIWQGKTG